MTNRLSAVVSFDTGNIQGNLLIVQGNLFRCHPWGCTIFIWNSPLHVAMTNFGLIDKSTALNQNLVICKALLLHKQQSLKII